MYELYYLLIWIQVFPCFARCNARLSYKNQLFYHRDINTIALSSCMMIARIIPSSPVKCIACLTHHGPVPHICVAIFSAYFPSAPDMGRWFQCSFPQCPIHGAWQTARSSPVPQIVVARPHLLSHQRPIYVARHGPPSLHVSCGKY